MTATTFDAFISGNSLRSPNWRWARALWLHRLDVSRRPPAGDLWVRRAVRFLAAHERGLSTSETAIAEALQISLDESPLCRWEIEARVLAGEPSQEVARKCRSQPETIAAYEHLHFDVRRYLGCSDWIMARAIRPTMSGIEPSEVGQLWKLFAYRGGVHVLEAIMDVTTADGRVCWPRPSSSLIGEGSADRVRRSAELIVLAMTLPTTLPIRQVVELQTAVRRLESARQKETAALNLLAKADLAAKGLDSTMPAVTVAHSARPKRSGAICQKPLAS